MFLRPDETVKHRLEWFYDVYTCVETRGLANQDIETIMSLQCGSVQTRDEIMRIVSYSCI